MTIPAVIISALWGSVTGYALSMWRFRGSELIFALILFGLFIPYQAVLIPLITTLQVLKLYGSLPGLALVHIIFGLPITMLIFRNFYAAIPSELHGRGEGRRRRLLGRLPTGRPAALGAGLRGRRASGSSRTSGTSSSSR